MTATLRLWKDFYPRPPRGGRHELHWAFDDTSVISIHALREEGDSRWSASWSRAQNFYPRPPRGGRPSPARAGAHDRRFLSTPSARRATRSPSSGSSRTAAISIHALREEGDQWLQHLPARHLYFYPRPPRGGRRALVVVGELEGGISIHALREEGDLKGLGK